MKKLQMFLVSLLLCSGAFAQIEVDAQGRVGIGTTPTTNNKLEISGNVTFNNNQYFNGAHLTFAHAYGGVINIGPNSQLDFRRTHVLGNINNYTSIMTLLGNGNLGIGTTALNRKLEVEGGARIGGNLQINNGCHLIFDYPYGGCINIGVNSRLDFRSNPVVGNINTYTNLMVLYGNGDLGIGREPSYKLDVNGYVRTILGVVTSSDERLKTEIKPLVDEIDKLYLLQGKFYKKTLLPTKGLVEEFVEEFIKQDEITTEDKEIISKPEEITEFPEYGFLAQELKDIFPDLVSQDAEGYYSINYIGLIPVIVEALKDQKQQNEAQQTQVEKQQAQINEQQQQIDELKSTCCAPKPRSAEVIIDEGDESEGGVLNVFVMEQAQLYQNTPNPFNQSTQIKFFVPENIGKALLCIYDLQGKQLKQTVLTQRGYGIETVFASEFPAGIYLYALLADGNQVDVKRMILTE